MPNHSDDPPLPEKNPAAVEMGRMGGKKGGLMRAARMSPEERSAAARQAAAARWARVAAESMAEGADGEIIPEQGGRSAKPFVLVLEPNEALEIHEAKGAGGQQTLHRRLVAQLAKGNLTVSLTDAQLGELIRYITRYGSGGFQSRLRRAFIRPLADLLDLRQKNKFEA